MTPSERLLFLADALEADAADPQGMKFDLTIWLDTPGGAFRRDCGTVGCAMGLACLLPEFQEQGLSASAAGTPRFDGTSAYNAAARFFDVPFEHAKFLFCCAHYQNNVLPVTGAQGELAVAKRIREYVENPEIYDEAAEAYWRNRSS